MKALFVCSANKDRSVTAEEYASNLYPSHEYNSAGTNQKICFQLGTEYIDKGQVEWAEAIFVMENKHKKELIRLFGTSFGKKIKVLAIKDYYSKGNATLKEILKEKLAMYL